MFCGFLELSPVRLACGAILPIPPLVDVFAVAEGLFIPEGWWHQITSTPGTVAVNVWFKVRYYQACWSTMVTEQREPHRFLHVFVLK